MFKCNNYMQWSVIWWVSFDVWTQLSTMTNELIEIHRKDLLKLRHLYKSNGINGYFGYMTLNNYIQWFEQDPNIKHVKVFSLNGQFSDGTFVLTVSVYLTLSLGFVLIGFITDDVPIVRTAIELTPIHCTNHAVVFLSWSNWLIIPKVFDFWEFARRFGQFWRQLYNKWISQSYRITKPFSIIYPETRLWILKLCKCFIGSN